MKNYLKWELRTFINQLRYTIEDINWTVLVQTVASTFPRVNHFGLRCWYNWVDVNNTLRQRF